MSDEAMKERAAVMAKEIRDAQIRAISEADRSGWWPTIITILALGCVQAMFGVAAAFWLGLGALIAIVMFLWETGRNVEIERQATEQWAADAIQRGDHLGGDT